jgi:hypothetical protein
LQKTAQQAKKQSISRTGLANTVRKELPDVALMAFLFSFWILVAFPTFFLIMP